MLDFKLKDLVSKTIVHAMTNTKPLIHCVRKRQLGFLGHILRLPDFLRKNQLEDILSTSHDKRRPGRPRTSYFAYIHHMLIYDENEMEAEEIFTLAKDRC